MLGGGGEPGVADTLEGVGLFKGLGMRWDLKYLSLLLGRILLLLLLFLLFLCLLLFGWE